MLKRNQLIFFSDNNLAISLSKNCVFHKKSKHIDTRFHFIREHVDDGDLFLDFCESLDQLVDISTKPLRKNVFEFQREHFGHCKCHLL